MAEAHSNSNVLSSKWINLAEERVGTKVLYATDDFFAEKENLIKPGRGVFIPDKYTVRGKWMDGWESRRKRTPGNDYCIIKLGLPGVIHGFDIDTNFFLGNHPPHASVDACNMSRGNPVVNGKPDNKIKWTEILPKVPLNPGSQNLFDLQNPETWTHLRLQIYPDGGVARFRVYGEVTVDWSRFKKKSILDLVAIENGGKVLTCNDMFFGPKDNLIMPGRGVNMGDGWETKRKRGPGFDWVILELGHKGIIQALVVDTAHFKGNYPDRCSVLAINSTREKVLAPDADKLPWKTLLNETKLYPNKQHYYKKELGSLGPVTHVKLNIFPDGGISRFRCFGVLA